MDNFRLLEEEIGNELENLKILKPGSEDHQRAVDSLAVLFKIKQDELESDNKAEDVNLRTEEMEIKAKEQKKDRIVKIALETAGIVVPVIFYGIWMKKGFMFEKDGTITSSTFKGLIRFFKPTKK